MGKDWNAVAEAVNTRLAELGMTQAELASKSRVSPAALRQIQHGVPPKTRRSPHTLAAISEALGWPSRHLEEVAAGEGAIGGQDRVKRLEDTVADLQERVRKLEEAAKS